MKPPPIPTAEQLAAIESELPKFTISASAGSGKTFVLTRRYVRHITEHGLTPDQILTITFTRKAAAEMKTRIVEMLTERGLMHEAQVAETGPIQTIHSFCDRLLRENSVEAGIDPDFQIMEQSALILENHVRFVIGQEQMNPYAQALIDQLAGERAWSRNQQGQKSKLEAVIQRLLGELRSSRFRLDDLLAWSEDPQRILEGFLPMLREYHGQDELDKLASLGDGDLIRGLEKLCEETISPEAKKVKVATVIRKCRSSGLEMAENICGILHLAAEAWGRLSFDMAREQEYDMAELERMSVQLLKTHPAVRERIMKQYRVVMVDEAQDMNEVQYELLDAMGLDYEMLVGDPQQSIYGFRFAAPDLFRARMHDDLTLKLTKNQRSVPGVLNFVDEFFTHVWQERYQPMGENNALQDDNFTGVELWELAGSNTEGIVGGVETLIHGERVPPGDICILVRGAPQDKLIVRALQARGIDAEILGGGKSFHTRLVVRDIANLLESILHPHDNFTMFAILRSPLVGLSLDEIVLGLGEQSLYDWLHSSPETISSDSSKRIDEFLEWYDPLRRVADRYSAWEALSEVYRLSPYLENLARQPNRDQNLANARKLLLLASGSQSLRPNQFANQIRRLQSLGDDEGEAMTVDMDDPVVKVMTIHKSKGLEFPVVIMPDCDKGPSKAMPDIKIDARSGLIATRLGEGMAWPYGLLTDSARQKEAEEWLRLVYVAMTRAQHRLILNIGEPEKEGGSAKKKDSTVASDLRRLFITGQGPRSGLVVRGEPWLYVES